MYNGAIVRTIPKFIEEEQVLKHIYHCFVTFGWSPATMHWLNEEVSVENSQAKSGPLLSAISGYY